jgi:hypothetical protein
MASAVVRRAMRAHRQSPEVYEHFKRFAREARASGRARFSADAILHRVRWYVAVERQGADFKVNNDCSALFSRLLEAEEPAFRGFFERRRSVFDGVDLSEFLPAPEGCLV